MYLTKVKMFCKVLDIINVAQAVGRLDDDEKGLHKIYTLGGNQELWTINESGLYSLTLTSNKPEAKAFKKWITSEVLPAIRKTGQYTVKSKTEPTAQDQFYKNHKTACLLFSDRLSRLRYANAVTLEQTGVDVLNHAGLTLPDHYVAIADLLNTDIDGKTIRTLCDSVHFQRLDADNAKTILSGLWLRVHKGQLYIGNPCPFITDRKALHSIAGITKNVAVTMNGKTIRATVITLY